MLYLEDDPNAPLPEEERYIGDITTSDAYRETHKQLITDPERQLLVPILGYIDGATTDQFGNTSVEAFKFTLGIYNNKTRNEEHAWPILGTVPNTAHKSGSSGSHIFIQSGHEASRRFEKACKDERDRATAPKNMNKASADYHAILSTILEPLNEMINEGMQFTP
jgi:hypothetical protein